MKRGRVETGAGEQEWMLLAMSLMDIECTTKMSTLMNQFLGKGCICLLIFIAVHEERIEI